jgi:predicted aldo/keto reductase-like oxidoreductase
MAFRLCDIVVESGLESHRRVFNEMLGHCRVDYFILIIGKALNTLQLFEKIKNTL